MEEGTKMDTNFGFSWFQPNRFQWLAYFRPFIVLLFGNALLQGAIVNGLISTSITSIEKRFKLTSVQSGTFAAIYDIFFVVMLVPLSIYAKKVNKVRCIGYGMLLVALGSIMVVLPEYLAGPYEAGKVSKEICVLNEHQKVCEDNEKSFFAGIFENSFVLLIVSQAFIGIGATPLFTYGFTCIDDFDAHVNTGSNMAFYMSASTIGPALAFIGGGFALNIWGDFLRTDMHELGIENRSDPRYIGLYWIGFVICGIIAIFTALPLIMFPKKLKDTASRKMKDVHRTDVSLNKDFSNEKYEYLKILWMLVQNKTILCITLMQSLESILMNGLITFVPKMIELLFGFKSSSASAITGALVIPVGVFGNFVGGWLSKKAEGRFRPSMYWVIGCTLTSAVLSSCLLLSCEQIKVASINVKPSQMSNFGTKDVCNDGCHCEHLFNPVCAPDSKLSFLSPCHAGCADLPEVIFGANNWTKCACSNSDNGYLIKGFCEIDCGYQHIIFFIAFCLMAFFIFVTIPIMQSCSVRVVHVEHRDQFLCLGWMFMRVLGSIPGVILFGYIFDDHCLFWQRSCDGEKCQYYDAKKLGVTFFLLMLITKIIESILLAIAAKSYKENNSQESINKVHSSRSESATESEIRLSFRKKLPSTVSPTTMVY